MPKVILMEPSTPGNIGAIARAMKNFALTELILINPKCDHLSIEAQNRAKHAKDILKKAKVKTPTYLKRLPLLIATTAQLGSDYNLPRSHLTPNQLSKKITKKHDYALLFGREGDGLTNEEIQQADIICHIPASPKYQTLNLSQAATILFYELYQSSTNESSIDNITPASKQDLQLVQKHLTQVLNKLEFSTKEKKDTQKTAWKRIFAKALLTRREAFAIHGFLKKLIKK
ncbi:MAG: RNA methyltransferase [Candidatus Woesearchaeota archaeon]|nr:RNA methyltransferase [Candidatus Woesearchaeota archaeon]MDP7457132.1 RNA methyltransferase [Candidatus Woesearchaeota archaeon]